MGEGVDIVGFMKFVFLTPKYRDGAAAARLKYLLNLKQERLNKPKPFYKRLWGYLVQKFPLLERDGTEARHEAALIIQDLWRARVAKSNALNEINKKAIAGEIDASSSKKRQSFIRGSELNVSDEQLLSESRSNGGSDGGGSNSNSNSGSRRPSYTPVPAIEHEE